jgi:hypothetical protein
MRHLLTRNRLVAVFIVAGVTALAHAQRPPSPPPAAGNPPRHVVLTIVDEHGLVLPGAQVVIQEEGRPALRCTTDYLGRCSWVLREEQPYQIRVAKPGYYETAQGNVDPQERTLRFAMTQEQVLQQEVNVRASAPGIDPEQVSNRTTLALPNIVNIPYPTNRDIRNLLPFTPGVVADSTGQVHVAGGETYMTLDTLDGFDIRSPVFGTLDLRVSTDAVRSIDTETTRYPVEYGRSTAGVIAMSTGMGDNRFRYNATDFIPSVQNRDGLRFDKFEPRLTFSGPIVRDRAWFFDAIDTEYDNIYIPGLPSNADTNRLFRAGNFVRFQINLGSSNSLNTALLVNDLHSPYEGLSTLVPQQSTTNHDIIAWLPYVRDQQSFRNGVMLDTGFGVMRYREGFEPHGDLPFELTPEESAGSNFENMTNRSLREEAYENVFFPPLQGQGTHRLRFGIQAAHTGFDENIALTPIRYLREDGKLLRRSVFPSFAPFTRHNLEIGSYLEDRWSLPKGLLIEPGIRFDWDQIIRRPEFSPRLAMTWSPPGQRGITKIAAGVGLYYEHTQLEYLTRDLAGTRYDTYYAPDGVTPAGPPLTTRFVASGRSLREAHVVNWSIGLQHRFPASIYMGANFMQKRLSDDFAYANQNGPAALSGTYFLTNNRQQHYSSLEVDARRTFAGGYTLFGSYTHSSARTNAALIYTPWLSILGPQQRGPLPWDTPNRVVSWGWLPAWAPFLPSVHKNWDFVYTFLWNTGFPINSVNANQQIVGPPGSHRFPNYLSFSPGLEWRFHFRGKYFGLRGVAENITDSQDPFAVNNNVDSPQYLQFTQPEGRAFTTRIRLIESSK